MKAFTVYCDLDSGEMTRVMYTPAFQSENALFRADVLKDARSAIAAAYDNAKADLLDELASGKKVCAEEYRR